MGRSSRHPGGHRVNAASSDIVGTVQTVVTYLDMTRPPQRPPVRPMRTGIEVREARQIPIHFYRYLYATIGSAWSWSIRRLLDDQELTRILHGAGTEVDLLWIDGVPAGLVELDFSRRPEIELAYFGLLPDFIGQGLGGFLL